MGSTTKNIFSRAFFAVAIALGSLIFTTGAGASPSEGACSTWVRMIDISSNQPHPINWTKVVESGVAGVYIKTTQNTNYVNPFFSGDAKQAVANGIPYGGYDFAEPSDNPISDAKFFVANGGADGQLPPVLDLETAGTSTVETLRWTFAWLNEIGALTGRFPVIYTGAYYEWSSFSSLGSWNLWLAAYPHGYQQTESACKLPLPVVSSPWAGKGWSIWQFSSRGSVPGIEFSVDLDVATSAWFQFVTNVKLSAPTSSGITTPIYAYGSEGTAVTYIQRVLYNEGLLPYVEITGVFDIYTKIALEKYQALMGVPVTGQWDPTSVSANIWYQANHRPVENVANYPTTYYRNHANVKSKVLWIQKRLNSAGFYSPATGTFTKQTRKEVEEFQKRHHIAVSGVVNLATWRALWSI